MKISILEVEATPAELEAAPAVLAALQRLGSSPRAIAIARDETSSDVPRAPAVPRGDQYVPGVADEGQDVVRALLLRNPAAERFRDFLGETTSWPKVAAFGVKRKSRRPSDPLDYSDYLRLRKQGSSVGGFAYTWPESGRITFRLKLTDDELSAVATSARTVQAGHREYRVVIDLRHDNLDEALALARRAYELT
jgi:hypothetical protein